MVEYDGAGVMSNVRKNVMWVGSVDGDRLLKHITFKPVNVQKYEGETDSPLSESSTHYAQMSDNEIWGKWKNLQADSKTAIRDMIVCVVQMNDIERLKTMMSHAYERYAENADSNELYQRMAQEATKKWVFQWYERDPFAMLTHDAIEMGNMENVIKNIAKFTVSLSGNPAHSYSVTSDWWNLMKRTLRLRNDRTAEEYANGIASILNEASPETLSKWKKTAQNEAMHSEEMYRQFIHDHTKEDLLSQHSKRKKIMENVVRMIDNVLQPSLATELGWGSGDIGKIR